jgi:membrane-associated phospholipid phosphatase
MAERDWRGLAAEAALNGVGLVVAFQAYKLARKAFIPRAEAVGYVHADQVVALERRLGIFVEAQAQAAFLRAETLIRPVNWFYASMMWLVVGAAVLALLGDRDRFRVWRRVFLASMLIALPWYLLYPLAPPRFLPEHGFVDTLAVWGPNYFAEKGLVTANRFAAMPSMHVGWTLIAAAALADAWRGARWAQGLAAVLAVGMPATVVVTGNHWLLDIVGGWLVAAAAWLVAGRRPAGITPWGRRSRARGLPSAPWRRGRGR